MNIGDLEHGRSGHAAISVEPEHLLCFELGESCNREIATVAHILLCLIVFSFVQIALLCPLHLTTCVFLLMAPWLAPTTPTIAAAATVLRTSHSPVPRTPPLGLGFGSLRCALQENAAVRVMFKLSFVFLSL